MTLYHPAPHARPLHPGRDGFPWGWGTRPDGHRLADHGSSRHEPGERAPAHGAFLRPSPATQPARSRAQTGRSTSTRSLGHLHVSAIALDLIAKRILEAVHFLARRAIDLVFDGRDGIGFGRVRAGHRFLGKIDLRDVAAQERHPLDLDKNISAVRKDVLRALGIVGLVEA